VVRTVAGIVAGGGTDIGEALALAGAELAGPRARAEAAPVIVLMTDGRPDAPNTARAAAQAARAAGATLYAIGLGDDVDVALLGELAGAADRVFAVPSEAELARVYTRIARRLATTTLLREITIEDELPPDMDYEADSAQPAATVVELPPGAGSGAGVTLRWTLRDVPPSGLRLTYRVLPRAAGLRPTNVIATGDYEDGLGFAGRVVFPVPRVRVAGDRQAYLPLAVQNRCPARRVDVVVVLDASSSMLAPAAGDGGEPADAGDDGGSKLAAARAAARAFVGYLALPQDRAAVVAFDASARLAHPLSGDRASLSRAIDAIRAGQGTRIDRGLATASEALVAAGRPGALPLVVLLTDGRPAPGSAEAALGRAAQLRGAGATIFAVGLGADVDGGFLVDLAGASERYLYAPTAVGLYDIYRGIALGLPCD
jgi:Mg-chelatase subunit ChlD